MVLTNAPRGGSVSVRGSDDRCCGVFFLKYVLYIFNVILLLSGAAILGVGLWTFFCKRWLAGLLGDTGFVFTVLMYSLIGIGGFIILFVFTVGCCGAVRKQRFCLMLYSFMLLLVFILEAGSGVLTCMYELNLHEDLTHILNQTLIKRYNVDTVAESSVDLMQTSKRCCGTLSYTDWRESDWYKSSVANLDVQQVPNSCCKTPMPGCASRMNPNNIFVKGCAGYMKDEFRVHLNIMGAMGMGLCCLQIFGIVFACCLAKRVRKWKSRNENNFWQQ